MKWKKFIPLREVVNDSHNYIEEVVYNFELHHAVELYHMVQSAAGRETSIALVSSLLRAAVGNLQPWCHMQFFQETCVAPATYLKMFK